jgi:hypothetical protein
MKGKKVKHICYKLDWFDHTILISLIYLKFETLARNHTFFLNTCKPNLKRFFLIGIVSALLIGGGRNLSAFKTMARILYSLKVVHPPSPT